MVHFAEAARVYFTKYQSWKPHLLLFHLAGMGNQEVKEGQARKGSSDQRKEWTIQVYAVECATGVRKHMETKKKVSVTLPEEPNATIGSFMRALNAFEEDPFGTATVMDLSPYDEAKLGKDTKHYGRGRDPDEQPNWVPTHSDPRPVNCVWKPKKTKPRMKVSKVGLCDGAELAIVKVRCFKG